jgi:hypothetical protein
MVKEKNFIKENSPNYFERIKQYRKRRKLSTVIDKSMKLHYFLTETIDIIFNSKN